MKANSKKKKKNTGKKESNESNPFARKAAIGIALIAFMLYANTIAHDFVLDDDIITRKNELVQKGFAGIPEIFSHGYLYGFNGSNDQSYRPLILVNMAIETALFGSNASVHHFFNVLFYALGCFLLVLFSFKLLGEKQKWWALAACLLFTVHPIHTEVVANIKSRDEILSFIFLVVSLNFLLKYLDKQKLESLIYSLLAYVACVWSKDSGLAMIGLVPFVMYYRGVKLSETGKYVSVFGAFLVSALAILGIRALVMDSIVFEADMEVINNSLAGASNYGEQFATNTSIMGRYLSLLVFPHPLSYDYSYNQIPIIGFGHPGFLLSFLVHLGLIVAAILLLIRKNFIGLGIIWYAVMLALVSNYLTMVGTPMAERFLYASSFGFALAFSGLIYQVILRFVAKKDQVRNFFIVIGIISLAFGIKTIIRNQDWKNPETLYRSGLITAPNSARAYSHYASFLREQFEYNPNNPLKNKLAAEAIEYYNKALEIYPEYSEASYNLGVVYYSIGDTENAVKAYLKTLEFSPQHTNSLNNLGVIFFNAKDYNRALEFWNRVIEYDPNNSNVLGNIGAIYQNNGQYAQAVQFYERSLAGNPQNVSVLGNIIKALNQLGQTQKASQYQQQLNQIQ